MAQTIRKNPNYLVIGVFMAIGTLAILVSVVFADKLITKLRGGYPLYVRFQNLDGLVIGSKVIVGSGKEIGLVEEISLDGSFLLVTIFVDNRYKINHDARFEIFSTSFVGGKYLAIENYTGLTPYLDKGTTIEGISPISINSIVGTFGKIFSSGTDEGVAIGLTGIITSVNDVVAMAETILKDNRTNIDQTLLNIARASSSLNSTMSNIDRKLGMVSDQEFRQILNDTKSSLKNLEIFLEDINSENAALAILKDPKIAQSIRTIITNLEETTERVKAKPSLLLRS
ncbi:MAG: MlaD family protein [Brevinema sp.]